MQTNRNANECTGLRPTHLKRVKQATVLVLQAAVLLYNLRDLIFLHAAHVEGKVCHFTAAVMEGPWKKDQSALQGAWAGRAQAGMCTQAVDVQFAMLRLQMSGWTAITLQA